MSRAWWEPRGVLRRFVIDLLADEMARHRRAAVPHASMWRITCGWTWTSAPTRWS